MRKTTIIASAIVFALGISACGEQKTLEQLLASANEYSLQRDFSSAVVELKNAVRLSPQNAEARLALGHAYLEQGNYIFSEKEYDKAIELGIDKLTIAADYINVKSKLERVEEVYLIVGESALLNDEQFIIVLTYAGITALRDKNIEKAQDYFEQAISISENNSFSYIAKGYLHQSKQSFSEGLKEVDKILGKYPDLSEALLLKGHLLFALNKHVEAAQVFNKYVNKHLKAYYVKFFEINSLLHANKIDEADKIVVQILESNDQIPLALQYKGQIELSRKNYEQAKRYSLAAANKGSQYNLANIVAGISAFKLNQIEQAHSLLQPFESQLPSDHPIKRILTYIKVKLNYQVEAINSLNEIENPSETDIELSVFTGFELLRSGNITQAKQLLDNVETKNEINSTALNAQLGLLKVSVGDENGLELLVELIEKDPSSIQANLALADAYLKMGENDKALSVALVWQKYDQNSVYALNLASEILINQGKMTQAETYIERALILKGDDVYSLLFLGEKAFSEKKYEKALNLAEKVLNLTPDNIKALSLFYSTQKFNNNPEVALNLIEESFLRNKNNMKYRLYYAKNLYMENKPEKVVELLKDLNLASASTSATFWIYLGGSYSQLSQNNKAIETFTDWTEKNPRARMAWFSKLSVQDKQRDIKGALATVKSIISAFPNDQESKVMLPYYQVQNKLANVAQQSLNLLTNKQKILPIVRGIQGQIWFSQKSFDKAYPELLKYYKSIPSSRNAGFVYTSLIKSNKKIQAFEFMSNHLSGYPDDVITKVFYAQLALELDLNVAQQVYQDLLSERKNNISFLANLAWVESQFGNYAKSIDLANQALLIDKNQPNVMDTLAMAHYANGDLKQAYELISKAKELAPNNTSISKHYTEISNSKN